MKLRSILTAVAVISCCTISQASITNVTACADGDGAIVCPVYSWDNMDRVEIYGDQHSSPADILGTISADSMEDPTLTINNSINNSSGFGWAGYQVDVAMTVDFMLSGDVVLPRHQRLVSWPDRFHGRPGDQSG
jgi:hypothetical protein